MYDTLYQVTCPFCKQVSFVSANDADVEAWLNGKLIQDALPYLSPFGRELVKTGICATCWDLTVGHAD